MIFLFATAFLAGVSALAAYVLGLAQGVERGKHLTRSREVAS